jgi:hypothetical protein
MEQGRLNMTLAKIGYQHGITATMNRLKKIDPDGSKAYEKLLGDPSSTNEGTLKKLVDNNNILVDKIAQMEAVLSRIPFPEGYS